MCSDAPIIRWLFGNSQIVCRIEPSKDIPITEEVFNHISYCGCSLYQESNTSDPHWKENEKQKEEPKCQH